MESYRRKVKMGLMGKKYCPTMWPGCHSRTMITMSTMIITMNTFLMVSLKEHTNVFLPRVGFLKSSTLQQVHIYFVLVLYMYKFTH